MSLDTRTNTEQLICFTLKTITYKLIENIYCFNFSDMPNWLHRKRQETKRKQRSSSKCFSVLTTARWNAL